MVLRIGTAILSLLLHASIAAYALYHPAAQSEIDSALEQGTGEDQMVIEQGIALEGLDKGTEVASVEAVEAPPPVVKPVEPVEEVKPQEDVQHVVASDAGPEQEKITAEPPPEEVKKVEEVKPQEVATLTPPPIAPVDEKVAAGKKQDGGDATALNAYRGKLFSHLSVKKVNPGTRQSGTAKVRFSFDPATGKLLTHEIVESSGSPALDDAALRTVERAAPFPPVPVAIAQGAFEVTVPFKFSVR